MSAKSYQGLLDCNRRDFIKAAGLGAAAMAIPGLIRNASAAPASSISQEVITTDVLIVGGGLAGTFAAIKAKKNGADVTIVDKGTVGRSGLSPFFGSLSYFKASDSVTREQFVASVSEAGKYLVRPDYLEMYMDDSAGIAEEFMSWGVGEDLRGGHGSTYRGQILKNDIRLIERVMITELFKMNGRIAGAIGFPMEEDRAVVIKAKAVVLCSGSGALKTPGFPCSSITHDGDAMAYRIGTEITGKEFCDFHWTHWKDPGDMYGNWENHSFHALSPSPHTLGRGTPEAPSMALQAHNGNVPFSMGSRRAGQGERASGAGRREGANERTSEAAGGEGAAERPGSGGGIRRAPPGTRSLDLPIVWGSTAGMSSHKCEGIFPKGTRFSSSIPGLFAAGDALFTGGATYSCGGSSASGSAVQGARAGGYAAAYAKENRQQNISDSELAHSKERIFTPRTSEKGFSPIWVTQVLQGIMVPYYVLNIKKQGRLEAALSNVEFLKEHFAPNLLANDTHQLRLAHETKNMLLNSEMKLRAGLMRTESRGDHYREDYPDQDDKNWLAWIIITRDGDSMKLEKKPVPDAWKPKNG